MSAFAAFLAISASSAVSASLTGMHLTPVGCLAFAISGLLVLCVDLQFISELTVFYDVGYEFWLLLAKGCGLRFLILELIQILTHLSHRPWWDRFLGWVKNIVLWVLAFLFPVFLSSICMTIVFLILC
jgi:hypothetical protein